MLRHWCGSWDATDDYPGETYCTGRNLLGLSGMQWDCYCYALAHHDNSTWYGLPIVARIYQYCNLGDDASTDDAGDTTQHDRAGSGLSGNVDYGCVFNRNVDCLSPGF